MEGRPTGTVEKRRGNNQNTRNAETRAFVPAAEIINAVREGRNIEELFHHVPPNLTHIRDRNNNPGPTTSIATSIFNDTLQSDLNGNSTRPTNLVAKRNARLSTTRLEEKEESTIEGNIHTLANKLVNDDKNGNNLMNSSQSALRCDNVPTEKKILGDLELEDNSSNTKNIDVKKPSCSKKPSEKSEKSRRPKSNNEGKKKRIKTSQTDLSRSDHREAVTEDRDEEQDPETLELAKLRCTSERTEVIAEREHRRQKRCADYPG